MKFICPLIVVEDMQKARYFYEVLLEQKVLNDFGENVTFEGGFAIHLKPHFRSLIEVECCHAILKETNNFELYFETEDLEGIQKILQAERFTFVHKIKEQPWMQRVLRVYDYDGHIVEIGESMGAVTLRLHGEGLTAEDIVKRTSMPWAFVEGVIEGVIDTKQ